MDEMVTVGAFQEQLLNLSNPLAALDLPLLDAHGATLASDLLVDEKPVIRSGQLIDSTQIALAASLGLDRLPCRPHPRVVIISAGDDLVEPGSKLADADDEFESNSWFLTTFAREVGAHAFRVHTIPETAEQLKLIIEDQLVRADLIVISGESKDESFDLITSVISTLGEIQIVTPKLAESSKHSFGLIGPDKTPVVTLPGDPIAAYISFELLIRPMIRTMLGTATIHRPSVKAKLEKALSSSGGMRSYVRAILSEDGKSVVPLSSQDEQATLSDANCFIAVPEGETNLSAGAQVTVVILERRYL